MRQGNGVYNYMYHCTHCNHTLIRNFNYHDTHVEGAKAIAEACRDTGVEKLIHFSALGASHDSRSRFMQSKVCKCLLEHSVPWDIVHTHKHRCTHS